MNNISMKTMIFLVALLLLKVSLAHPQARIKRSGISDTRLAELETQVSLNRPRSGSVAYGIFDPSKIGKRTFHQFRQFPEPTDIVYDDPDYIWNTPKDNYQQEAIIFKNPFLADGAEWLSEILSLAKIKTRPNSKKEDIA
ncbi:uncharacterized protein LOC111085182 [Limulus polyphemus]|uniref:Uncharacterized protein LOC111085182 n=1 Tax=Limulus polyphemus TaxID=6850 RepID=A0ABM1S400_LIMPO|nr:uncharacterized protein LOC111085182 [Limulus polyphemus]